MFVGGMTVAMQTSMMILIAGDAQDLVTYELISEGLL
jgi:hypothetical protein